MAAPRVYTIAESKDLGAPTPQELEERAHLWRQLIAARDSLANISGPLTDAELDELLWREDGDGVAVVPAK